MDTSIFTHHGKYFMAALDHRGSFVKLLQQGLKKEVSKGEIIEAKKNIIESVYDYSSGLLLDPEYGLPAYRAFLSEKKVPPKPYLLCIEKSGYEIEGQERRTLLQWTVEELKDMGAEGIKILLFFHPRGQTVKHQINIVKKVIKDCQRWELPFFFEFLTYPIGQEEYNTGQMILESIGMFRENGIVPDVYKLEYPGSGEFCYRISTQLSTLPWILLTKGADYASFRDHLKIAAQNGVSGFLAGRSLWQEFPALARDKREKFFKETVPKRFEEISDIVLHL